MELTYKSMVVYLYNNKGDFTQKKKNSKLSEYWVN